MLVSRILKPRLLDRENGDISLPGDGGAGGEFGGDGGPLPPVDGPAEGAEADGEAGDNQTPQYFVGELITKLKHIKALKLSIVNQS